VFHGLPSFRAVISSGRASLRAALTRAPGPGALLRRHWLLAILLAAGLALRVAAQLAYRPALLYIDSVKYLYKSGGSDPVGYRVLLDPLTSVANLDLVAAVQHAVGLAMAVAIYVLLLRRGVARWLAALAAAPILLDGYQLQTEQTIMPDVMFETLIVAGLVFLLWNPRPRTWAIVAGGLAFGACAPVRQIGEVFIVPAAIFVGVVIGGWRRKLTQGLVLCAAFALPILAYDSANLAVTGHFRLAYTGVNEIYGRLVIAGNCKTLALPSYEQALCPTHQQAVQLGIDGLDPAHVRPREGLAATAIEERPVGRDRRDRAGRRDDRVGDAEPRDVHANGRRERAERRRCGGSRAGEHARDDDQRRAGQPHTRPAYTSGLSTPMNGRLRYRSAKSSP